MSFPLGFVYSLAYSLLISSFLWLPLGVAAGKEQHVGLGGGYKYGQPVPVTCLNRTIDSGEHITDNLGKLQYVAFPTCNETFQPLALRYGISETVTCTITSLPDTLYHLLEYYVHSDVPLTCRVPTGPLKPSAGAGAGASSETERKKDDEDGSNKQDNAVDVLNNDGPAYTPLMIALQGTLQRSHLHIWTDMNVLVHKIGSVLSPTKKKAVTGPGYVVAGTAYSVPEFDVQLDEKETSSKEARAAALIKNARDPWSAGHGTKVIRGEPLTFTFRVNWAEGGEEIGWTVSSSSSSSSGGAGALFAKMVFFVMAASVGALAALYWERSLGRRRGGWKGDGILGGPAPVHGRGSSGVTYGDGGRVNGYGGYGLGIANGGSTGGGGYGYGGYPSGKRD